MLFRDCAMTEDIEVYTNTPYTNLTLFVAEVIVNGAVRLSGGDIPVSYTHLTLPTNREV